MFLFLNFRSQKDSRFPSELFKGRYEFIKFLASGSYGDVCKARCLRTGQEVAIKRIHDVFENKTEPKRLLRELRILRLFKHAHIVGIVDIIPPKDLDRFDSLYVQQLRSLRLGVVDLEMGLILRISQ